MATNYITHATVYFVPHPPPPPPPNYIQITYKQKQTTYSADCRARDAVGVTNKVFVSGVLVWQEVLPVGQEML